MAMKGSAFLSLEKIVRRNKVKELRGDGVLLELNIPGKELQKTLSA